MQQVSVRRTLVRWSLGAALWAVLAAAQASPITLDTSWLDANGRLTLTTDARQTLALTGIAMDAGGKGSTLSDGVFNLPISQISADIRLLPPSLTLLGAQVKGATLDFTNTLNQHTVSLSDLRMDFSTHTVYGDLVSAEGTSPAPLFTFEVTAPLSFSLKGGISVNTSLGNLHFSSEGASSFAHALGVPDFLAPVLQQVDFGSIDAKVVPWFRTASAAGMAVVSVPEPASAWLWCLGAMALVAARRRARHAPLPGGRG